MKTSEQYGRGHIERLRQRFKQGKVSREEILELLISYVIKGRDVKPQAKQLYSKSDKSFRRVFNAARSGEVDGFGEQAEVFFGVVEEFVQEYIADSFNAEKQTIRNQNDIIDYYKSICALSDKEETHAMFLDAKNGVLRSEKLTDGTITQSLMYPREIIKIGLKCGAVSVIVMHNHPSGDTNPSHSDIQSTKRLYFALKEVDMNLTDHIIIGTKGEGFFSFQRSGLLSSMQAAYRVMMETI